jgi:hypothetical protein
MDCGYNLRGLPGDGRCPECGQDIAGSLAYHTCWSHPLRLRAVRTGGVLLAGSQALWLVVSPLLMVIGRGGSIEKSLLFWCLIVFSGPRAWTIGVTAGEYGGVKSLLIGVGLLLVPTIGQVMGLWRLTIPLFPGEQDARWWDSRRLLRLFSVLMPLPLVALLITKATLGVSDGGLIWGILSAIMLVGDMVVCVLVGHRLRRVAQRIDRARLGGWCRVVTYCIATAEALISIHLFTYLVGGFKSVTLPAALTGIYSMAALSLCFLGMVVCMVRRLHVLVRSSNPAPVATACQ